MRALDGWVAINAHKKLSRLKNCSLRSLQSQGERSRVDITFFSKCHLNINTQIIDRFHLRKQFVFLASTATQRYDVQTNYPNQKDLTKC